MTNVISHPSLELFATNKRSIVTAADFRVGIWLLCIALLVLCMVIVGGATRLTDSGLSITHWSPINGAIPPLNQQQWLAEFERYKQIPEYRLQNKGMSLADFQFIFWWEWAHRLLGRLVGVIFALPLAVFLVTKQIRKRLAPWLITMFLLGGLQGAIGWWMVSSGLSENRLDVAAYRLATHLSMAIVLMSLALWTALDLLRPKQVQNGDAKITPWAIAFVAFLGLQIVMGAFVAGTDAGLVHNDWPSFDGGLYPKNYAELVPFARNLVENTAAIQFNHRIGAYCILLLSLAVWTKTRVARDPAVRVWGHVVLALVAAQVLMGIATLLGFGIWAPPQVKGVLLGVCHQALGAILFASAMMLLRASLRMVKPSVSIAV